MRKDDICFTLIYIVPNVVEMCSFSESMTGMYCITAEEVSDSVMNGCHILAAYL